MTNMIDKDYQHRIDYEIVVDCYDEYEQAMGWIIYLSDNIFIRESQVSFQSSIYRKIGHISYKA